MFAADHLFRVQHFSLQLKAVVPLIRLKERNQIKSDFYASTGHVT